MKRAWFVLVPSSLVVFFIVLWGCSIHIGSSPQTPVEEKPAAASKPAAQSGSTSGEDKHASSRPKLPQSSPKLEKITVSGPSATGAGVLAGLEKTSQKVGVIDLKSQRALQAKQARKARLPAGISRNAASGAPVPSFWFRSKQSDDSRCVLYLHGGAYTSGSVETHKRLIGLIARAARARVLAVDYRLAPEHPHPAALEDAEAVYTWMAEQGCPPSRTAIVGDSAGGGLTLATLLTLSKQKKTLPAAAAVMSPWTDLTGKGPTLSSHEERDPILKWQDFLQPMALNYAGAADPTSPLISPVYGDFTGLPPLLIQVGDKEILLSDSTRLAEQAAKDGVVVRLEIWQGMWHVWQAFAPKVPESVRAIDGIGSFIIAHIP